MDACRNSRKFAFCKILYSTLFSTYFCQGGCRPPSSRKAFCPPKALKFQPFFLSHVFICVIRHGINVIQMPCNAWGMLEYTDFGWWQAREEGSAVSLMPKSESSSSQLGFWPWFSENSTMEEILEQLGTVSVCGDLNARSVVSLWLHVLWN